MQMQFFIFRGGGWGVVMFLSPPGDNILERNVITMHFHIKMNEPYETKIFSTEGENLKLLTRHYVSVH